MAGAGGAGQGRARPVWGAPEPPRKPTPPAKRAAKAAKAPAKAGKPAKPASGRAPAKAAPKRKRKAPATGAGARPPGRPRKAPARRRAARRASRYAVVYDVDGPRVRLGILWFVAALPAIAIGSFTTAIIYASAAAVAAAQMARCWHTKGARASDVMAAGGAGLIGAGACFGAGGAGLGILATVALAFVGAAGDTRSRNPRIADIGWTLQCALAPGLVAMSMVLLARLDQGSAIALLLLVSAYETGDYLIGSGATNPYEGPAAGAAAIVVITFMVSTLPISTLSFGESWLFGGAVAVLAPAGQLLASALLPAADSPASSLRRLDSLLITAPVWAWGVGLVVS
jgi:hypothetical protein